MNDKNVKSKINVLFSSSKLLIEFITDPYFEGRKLVVKGEALSCGFDAFSSSMKWLKPNENGKTDKKQKIHIRNVICEYEKNLTPVLKLFGG